VLAAPQHEDETVKKFAILIYQDAALADAVPAERFDASMRDCLDKADALRSAGRLLDSQMLEDPGEGRLVRVRDGKRTIVDGPFAEAKELIAGFNIIEAEDIAEAERIACEFPWAATGCIEVREIRDIETVRRRVFSSVATQSA
jgi:hypothetical protein